MIKPTTRTINDEKVRGIRLPKVDRTQFDHVPSAAYEAVATTEDPDDPRSVVLDAEVPEDRFLPFQKPGGRVGSKAMYTVKAVDPTGVVVQLPLEDQINNNVSSPDTFLGLNPYAKRGFNILFDPSVGKGVFCPTADCWAEWDDTYGGFCTEQHRRVTKPPNRETNLSQGATTSGVWAGRG